MASAAPPVPALPRRRRQGRPGATHAGYNEGETAAWAYVGVDACRAGWVAVRRDQQGKWDVGVYPRISDLLEAHRHAVLVLIDMPIGLPDGEQVKFRACDELAAAIVGRAKVFAVPPRPALEADDVRTALAMARRLTGKGFFLVWRLKDRIFEVEEVLGSPDSPWRGRLREAHPEVCFASLRRGPHGEPAPAVFPKQTPPGRNERLASLAPLIGSAVLNRLKEGRVSQGRPGRRRAGRRGPGRSSVARLGGEPAGHAATGPTRGSRDRPADGHGVPVGVRDVLFV